MNNIFKALFCPRFLLGANQPCIPQLPPEGHERRQEPLSVFLWCLAQLRQKLCRWPEISTRPRARARPFITASSKGEEENNGREEGRTGNAFEESLRQWRPKTIDRQEGRKWRRTFRKAVILALNYTCKAAAVWKAPINFGPAQGPPLSSILPRHNLRICISSRSTAFDEKSGKRCA